MHRKFKGFRGWGEVGLANSSLPDLLAIGENAARSPICSENGPGGQPPHHSRICPVPSFSRPVSPVSSQTKCRRRSRLVTSCKIRRSIMGGSLFQLKDEPERSEGRANWKRSARPPWPINWHQRPPPVRCGSRSTRAPDNWVRTCLPWPSCILVDPEKVILRQAGFEYRGVSDLAGRAESSRRPAGGREKCAKKLRGACGSSLRRRPGQHSSHFLQPPSDGCAPTGVRSSDVRCWVPLRLGGFIHRHSAGDVLPLRRLSTCTVIAPS